MNLPKSRSRWHWLWITQCLPIQGPAGSGKTYTGARMIVALVNNGLKVGLTAVSHKVISKLLEEKPVPPRAKPE